MIGVYVKVTSLVISKRSENRKIHEGNGEYLTFGGCFRMLKKSYEDFCFYLVDRKSN